MKKIYLPNDDNKISLKQYTLYYNDSDVWDFINNVSLQMGASRRAFIPIFSYEKGGRIYHNHSRNNHTQSNSGIISRHGFVELSNDTPNAWLFANEPQIVKDFCACMEQGAVDVSKCPTIFSIFTNFYNWKKTPNIRYHYRHLSDSTLFLMYLEKTYPKFYFSSFNTLEELKKNENQSECFFSLLKLIYSGFYSNSSLFLKPLETFEVPIVQIEEFLKMFYLGEEKVIFLKDLEEECIKQLHTSLVEARYLGISQYEQPTLEFVRDQFEVSLENAKVNQKVLRTNKIID